MNKISAMACVSLASLALAGCSTLSVFEGRHLWYSKEDGSPPIEIKIDRESRQGKDGSLDAKEQQKDLSKYVIDTLPSWMDLESGQKGLWSSFEIRRGESFSSALAARGYATGWLRDLRRTHFFDLSTIYDGQEVWVNATSNGAVNKLYTSPETGVWYHVAVTEAGPVMYYDAGPVQQTASVRLSPETRASDLSTNQKQAVALFVRGIKPSLTREMKVMLANGEVEIRYQFALISGSQIGETKVLRATVNFAGQEMVYIPE